MLRRLVAILLLLSCSYFTNILSAQGLIHPGIDQTGNDLEVLRKKIADHEEPYYSAFEKLKKDITAMPAVDSKAYQKQASFAYKNALAFYITHDTSFAISSLNILENWKPSEWNFEYNEARTIALQTCADLCNAAEILKASGISTWKNEADEFATMLVTSYFPLLRSYTLQPAESWSARELHAIAALAVLADNRTMFNNVVQYFLYGSGEGSMFKYILPDGQINDADTSAYIRFAKIGELSGVARIAFSQGKDLFSAGSNRLANGYEFIVSEMMNNKSSMAGQLKSLKDGVDCEYLFRHYAGRNISMPFGAKLSEVANNGEPGDVLRSVRMVYGTGSAIQQDIVVKKASYHPGARKTNQSLKEESDIVVKPGENIQAAVSKAAGTGRKVLLKNGKHILHSMLKMPSSVILGGEGSGTVIVAAVGFKDSILIGNVSEKMHNVQLKDLRILNTADSGALVKRVAVSFDGGIDDNSKYITFRNVSIDNFFNGGVVVKGIDSVLVDNCDVNGGSLTLTKKDKLNYNLSFIDCADVTVTNSRLSAAFAGIMIDDCDGVSVIKTDISRNGGYGVRIFGSRNVEVVSSFFEGNDRSALIVEKGGSEKIALRNNIFQYNTGYGVEAYLAREVKTVGNTYLQNRDGEAVVKSAMISVVE